MLKALKFQSHLFTRKTFAIGFQTMIGVVLRNTVYTTTYFPRALKERPFLNLKFWGKVELNPPG